MKENIRLAVEFLYDIFLRHPKENEMGYFKHFFKTMKMSYQMGIAAIALLIHAFFPKYFQDFGEKMIEKLSMQDIIDDIPNMPNMSNIKNIKEEVSNKMD